MAANDKVKVKIKSIPKTKGKGRSTIISPFPNFDPLHTPGIIETNQTGTASQDIADSVKPVDRQDATIEAEKGEVIVKPMLDGMYKIGGKTHEKGGTPLAPEPKSFIFSNDQDLAFTKQEKELFSFKKGAGNKPKNNTPAKVIQREVTPKDYNKLVSILLDDKKDMISKTTAAYMMENYQKKIGQVALLQEAKKGLPQGVPEFAAPPPPANKRLKSELSMFKRGGTVLRRFDGGGIPYPPDKYGRWSGDNGGNGWNAMKDFTSMQDYANKIGYTGAIDLSNQGAIANSAKAMQHWVGANYPDLVAKYHSSDAYGMPSAGTPYDGKLGVRWNDIGKEISRRQPIAGNPMGNITPNLNVGTPTAHNITDTPAPGPKADGEIPWQGYNIPMNAAEKLSIAAPFLSAISQPTYYAMLQQKYTPNIRLDRFDNSQEVNTINQQSSLAQREMFGNMDAGTAYLNSDAVRANQIAGVGRSNANMQQQNIGVANQETGMNYQAKQNDQTYNLGQIGQTYDRNVMAKQNRDMLLQQGTAQSLNNAFDVEQNLQNLEQQATAAATPYITDMKDASGNQVLVNGPDGRKYAVQGVPFGFNKNRMPVFQPGFGDLNALGIQMMGAGNQRTIQGIMGEMNRMLAEGIKTPEQAQMFRALGAGAYGVTRNNAQQAYHNPFLGLIPQFRMANGLGQ